MQMTKLTKQQVIIATKVAEEEELEKLKVLILILILPIQISLAVQRPNPFQHCN